MTMQKVSDVARRLKVSCQSVYKKLSKGDTRLTPHIHKKGSATFLDEEGFVILSEMFGKTEDKTVSPGDTQVTTGDTLVETMRNQLKEKQQTIEAQQRTIESLIFQSEEARKRTDTILMKLTNDISSMQKALEYRQPEQTRYQEEKSQVIPEVQKARVDPRELPREVIVSQREISTWESVQITFNNVMGFLFGIDPGRKAA